LPEEELLVVRATCPASGAHGSRDKAPLDQPTPGKEQGVNADAAQQPTKAE
jgi:hypothetical protein